VIDGSELNTELNIPLNT